MTTLDELAELLDTLERRRPLVIAQPGLLTDAHRELLDQLGAEVREDPAALPGHIILVNRAALDDDLKAAQSHSPPCLRSRQRPMVGGSAPAPLPPRSGAGSASPEREGDPAAHG